MELFCTTSARTRTNVKLFQDLLDFKEVLIYDVEFVIQMKIVAYTLSFITKFGSDHCIV